MKIPLPCNLGEVANCNGRELQLKGVTWFKWSRGMEYTYFFSFPDTWHNTDFYTTFEAKQPCEFIIQDELLIDKSIKEHGYPLKGKGYAYGVSYKKDTTYIEFIMTSNYFAHIYMQCGSNGMFIPDGDIIFPMSWNEEKKDNAILKNYKASKDKALSVGSVEPRQMTIFDFFEKR